MMNPVLNRPAFRRLRYAQKPASCFSEKSSQVLCLLIFLFLTTTSQLSYSQPVQNLTGPTVVCKGSTTSYFADFHAGSTWFWNVTGGIITENNGNSISVNWNGPANSSQTVMVTETDMGGMMGSEQLTVLIKNNVVSCENGINVTLDQSGSATITPNMLLTGNYNSYDGFIVSITTNNGTLLGDQVSCAQIGAKLTAKVKDSCTGNSCWSMIRVEDKRSPMFDCPAISVMLPCNGDFETYPPPVATDNCDPNPFVSLSSLHIDNSDVCNGVWVTKVWVATDKYGNVAYCTQMLHNNPVAVIDLPKDRIWECRDYFANPNITNPTPYTGVLSTTGSGVPTGNESVYCPYTYVHRDDTLASCGKTFKIIRTWTVLNWCTGEIILTDFEGDDSEQIVKIVDTTPPSVNVPPITLSANVAGTHPHLCGSTGLLPPPVISEECGEILVQIFTDIGEAVYVNGVNGKQGGHVPTPGLKIGIHNVRYKVTDDCGNVTEILVKVTVVDDKKPTAICDEFTNVNLDVFGVSEVFAETFDDGSHDNCCIDRMVVKRNGQPDSYFGPTALFNCGDDSVMVVLRVYDCFDNYGECMVTALVRDKISPVCIPPPEKTIPCGSLPDSIDQAFLNTQGAAITNDNCGSWITELPHQESLTACGDGYILRHFVATDSAGNISGTCTQKINVTPFSKWKIHFPPNWYGECRQVENADSLFIDNIGCDQFAVSVTNQYFSFASDSACYKIVRTYRVTNWCKYDPYEPITVVPSKPEGVWITDTTFAEYGRFEYQQILTVHDNRPPLLSYPYSNEFCSYDAACDTGHVYIPIKIEGECSNEFEIVYHLDLHTDFSYEHTGTGFFDGNLPLGHHRIRYLVRDGCHNESQIVVDFHVKDCKPPSPVCLNGLVVEIMQTRMIEICAKSFDDKSSDNCPGPLKFSFSEDVGDSCRIFTCDDTYLNIPIKMWVTDAAGNKSFCETSLVIQDNMFSCDSGLPLSGYITTQANHGVEGVQVQVNGSNASTLSMMTGQNGHFAFEDLQNGFDYSITPTKTDGPLNGVSTFDLVIISRHILGVATLDSPYKMIAADANRSNSITTFDLVELRKLILFINTDFPNNTSWRFVDKKYQFPNPANPWQAQFPEVLNANNLNIEIANADFVAIKVGDVNGSAITGNNVTGTNQDRAAGKFILRMDEQLLETGKTYEFALKTKDFAELAGFQFTLRFDHNVLEFQSVIPSKFVQEGNIGQALLASGLLTVSWNEALPVTVSEDETLVKLIFKAISDGNISNAVSVNSQYTPAEAYIGHDLETRKIVLEYNRNELALSQPFDLFQNIPNPFTEKTVIGFQLPEPGNATLTIFDVYGKVVCTIEGQYPSGFNEITLDRKRLPADGMLFYRLDTPAYSATKTMTLITR